MPVSFHPRFLCLFYFPLFLLFVIFPSLLFWVPAHFCPFRPAPSLVSLSPRGAFRSGLPAVGSFAQESPWHSRFLPLLSARICLLPHQLPCLTHPPCLAPGKGPGLLPWPDLRKLAVAQTWGSVGVNRTSERGIWAGGAAADLHLESHARPITAHTPHCNP